VSEELFTCIRVDLTYFIFEDISLMILHVQEEPSSTVNFGGINGCRGWGLKTLEELV
jgi:hypothetical protein